VTALHDGAGDSTGSRTPGEGAADVNADFTIRPEPADTVKFLLTLKTLIKQEIVRSVDAMRCEFVDTSTSGAGGSPR
jgi:hypothetical protein